MLGFVFAFCLFGFVCFGLVFVFLFLLLLLLCLFVCCWLGFFLFVGGGGGGGRVISTSLSDRTIGIFTAAQTRLVCDPNPVN